MSVGIDVAITGLGAKIPGIVNLSTFLECISCQSQPSALAFDEHTFSTLSRYKDRATKLALLASESALLDAGLPCSPLEQVAPESFGLVASSNLGNLETVCRVDEIIRARHVKYTSPMDFPNLSSNIVSSSVAIQFGLKAINLMLCNGATSGIDALYIAANIIRAGRAKRVLVVGVEPVDATVNRLMHESAVAWLGDAARIRLMEASGAVVLESATAAAERCARVYGWIKGFGYGGSSEIVLSLVRTTEGKMQSVNLWLTPNCEYAETSNYVKNALKTLALDSLQAMLDVSMCLGETYGALGILQCIVACLWLNTYHEHQAVITSGAAWKDGVASLMIERTRRE